MKSMGMQNIAENRFQKFLDRGVKRAKDLASILQDKPPAKRARLIHHNFKITQKIPKNSPCKSGCNSCCHLYTEITSDEAALMSKLVEEDSSLCDSAQIVKQLPVTREQYSMLSKEERRCAFLINGKCSIYENRPTICRSYLVTSDPKHCEEVNFQKIKMHHTMEAETYATAALYIKGNTTGKMANMLFPLLKEII